MKLSDRMYYVWLDAATMLLKVNNNDVAGAIANADALVEAATERFAWITAPDKETVIAERDRYMADVLREESTNG